MSNILFKCSSFWASINLSIILTNINTKKSVLMLFILLFFYLHIHAYRFQTIVIDCSILTNYIIKIYMNQSVHLQMSVHSTPAWKHSQYFFIQPDFLQEQPLLCFPVGFTASLGSFVTDIFGFNAKGFRSKVF